MRLRNILMGGIAFSFALLPQMALAEDSTAKDNKPTPINEADGARHDRGIGFTPIVPRSTAVAPAVVPVQPAKTATFTTAPVKKTVRVNVATAKHPVSSPVKKKQQEPLTAKATPNVEPKSNTTAPVLVNYKNQEADGPVIAAKLDREGHLPKYKVGDKMVVNVKANQDCNVVVFNYDSSGTLTQIFPNDYQQNGFVKAGDSVEIGGSDSPFDYQISGKGGPEKVFVYAYPTNDKQAPLTQLTAMAPISGTPFRGTEMTVDQYRDLVNSSKVFFSRGVQVMPKKGTAQLVSQAPAATSPNKVELTFSVEAK